MIEKDRTGAVKRAVREATRHGLNTAAVLVEGEATTLCPVDTGNLKGSLTHLVSDTEALVGTNVEYAPYVEPRKPFLRPALDNNRANVNRVMRDAYQRAVKGAL